MPEIYLPICAFDDGEECKALVSKNCVGCRFYKSTKELKQGRKRAELRLKTLPNYIYYCRKYGAANKIQKLRKKGESEREDE